MPKKFEEYLNKPSGDSADAGSPEGTEKFIIKNSDMEGEKPGIDFWIKRFNQYILSMDNRFMMGDVIDLVKNDLAKAKTEEQAKQIVLEFEAKSKN